MTRERRRIDAIADPGAFWGELGGYFFHRDTWERAPREAQALVELASLEPGARVLDLCCGPGRIALELAALDMRVTGVDWSRPMVDDARRRAAERGLDVELVEADVRDFRREGGYDLVLDVWTSFGYSDDPDDDLRVLENARASLAPGGMFVLETISKDAIALGWPDRTWGEHDDGFLLVQESRLLSGWDRVEHRWIVIDGDDRREFRLAHRVYNAAELADLLGEAGFGGMRFQGDFAGAPYLEGGGMVVVAHP